MSSFMGMDTSDVRSRAALLGAQAVSLAEVDAALRRIFDGGTWVGLDAEAAREHLHSQALPALQRVQSFLNDTALLMIQNADQQEQASSG